MIYFIADLHFNHKNSIVMCDRPFKDVDEMNAKLIESWNRKVKNDDQVYILGDIALGPPPKVKPLMNQLNGRKYLIRGNHDTWVKKPNNSEFEWVKDYFELRENGNLWILCHYPLFSWNGRFRGAIHLHGHTHKYVNLSLDEPNNPNIDKINRFACVSVECINYQPISIDELKLRFNIRR